MGTIGKIYRFYRDGFPRNDHRTHPLGDNTGQIVHHVRHTESVFLPDFLSSRFGSDAEKSDYVSGQLVKNLPGDET